MRTSRTAALLGAMLLAACSGGGDSSDKKAEDQGREETRNIRNTEAIGYSGGAVADKVDAALDANDQRNKELEKTLEQSESGE